MKQTDGRLMQFLKWFASLDRPTQGNIQLIVVTAAIGFAIYTKPEQFGPWLLALLGMFDLKSWLIISMGLFTVYNMSAGARARESRLEAHIRELERHVEHLEDRINSMQKEHIGTVRAIANQRDRCHQECSHYRSAISLLVVAASRAGAGEQAQDIIESLDAGLRESGLRSFTAMPKPGGSRSDDPP